LKRTWFTRSTALFAATVVGLAFTSIAAAAANTSDTGASDPMTGSSGSAPLIRHITKVSSISSLSNRVWTGPSGGTAGPEIARANLGNATNRKLSKPFNPRAPFAAAIAVPSVAPSAVSTISAATKSFNGLNDYQQRYVASGGNQFTITPPDQGLCVGNGYVLETVNDVVRVYSSSTGAALSVPIGMNAFYGYPPEINRSTGQFGPEPTDPNCYYEPQYGRFIHVALTLEVDPNTGALTGDNHLDIAVSASNNPLSGWSYYVIPVQDDGTQGTPTDTSCPCIGDFPHIGADANGFYITTNEYPFSGPGLYGNGYNGAQLYAMSKHDLAQASPTLTILSMGGATLLGGVPSFTMWPDEVPGTAYDTRHQGSEWFLQSSATLESLNTTGMSNKLGVWRLSNTASLDTPSPSLVLRSVTLSAEAYGIPPPSEQKVGSVPLRDCLQTGCLAGVGPSTGEVESAVDSSDSRMLTNWMANGQLLGALDTVANVNGRYQAGVAFFVVNTNLVLGSTTIANQGYVAVNGNVIYPSIATSASEVGMMAITLVGKSNFPSAAYVNVGATGPTGSVVVAKMGAGPDDEFCGYLFYDCAGSVTPAIRPRWGDYGAAVMDGADIWLASEFIAQTCTIDTYQVDPHCGSTRATLGNWGTRITRFGP
jgi:hypothetical protein